MRTWEHGERAFRREAAIALRDGSRLCRCLVVAVGGERPGAVIAIRALDAGRPARTLAELAVLAAEFRPSRVLVGLHSRDDANRRQGMLMAYDLQLVADGRVEMLRAWRWQQVLGRVLWLPIEARHWRVGDNLLTELAQAIIAERPADHDPDRLRHLVTRHLAAGHGVHLSPALSSRGALPDS